MAVVLVRSLGETLVHIVGKLISMTLKSQNLKEIFLLFCHKLLYKCTEAITGGL